MKYAAIDIGTNTILLAIVQRDDEGGSYGDIVDMSTIVRLGEGLAKSGRLSARAMSRTMEDWDAMSASPASHGIERPFCVGTAGAERGPRTAGRFLASVQGAFGFDVEIISARDEARYNYLSVRDDHVVRAPKMTIIDIGGGSTEVIDGTDRDFAGMSRCRWEASRLTMRS
jgi:exopolyphosphatase/guanosine-5'-triphosphate,3'-diphosphate pyrophosphatase